MSEHTAENDRGFDALVDYERAKLEKGEAYWERSAHRYHERDGRLHLAATCSGEPGCVIPPGSSVDVSTAEPHRTSTGPAEPRSDQA